MWSAAAGSQRGGFLCLGSPGSLRQRVGGTSTLKSGTAFWGGIRTALALLHRPPQTPSSGGNPYSIQRLLGQGTVVYGRRQWGHWQWSSTALIHHSRLQSGFCQILGGVFPFFSSVCRGALENEVAVECFNGSH